MKIEYDESADEWVIVSEGENGHPEGEPLEAFSHPREAELALVEWRAENDPHRFTLSDNEIDLIGFLLENNLDELEDSDPGDEKVQEELVLTQDLLKRFGRKV